MNAIILAAGKGNRLGPICSDNPKCLVDIDGVSLIERQIRALRELGIHDITAVVGFGADRVRHRCGSELNYIENPQHAQTNSLYSMWLARHLLSDGFIVLNADVLFHTQLLIDLLATPHEDALLVSYGPISLPGDEEMKVKVRNGLIVDISKDMNPLEADGENVGILKFGSAGARVLIDRMDLLLNNGNLRAWLPRALLEFSKVRKLHALSTRDYPWIEIDFPEDYGTAINETWPAITSTYKQFERSEIVRNEFALS